MLKRVIDGRWITANAVLGLYPAHAVNDDDIELYTDESRNEVAMTWHGLRQQTEKQEIDGVMRPSRCLTDFVAPKGAVPDYVGLFAVTTGIGVEKREQLFLDTHDDYSAIMFKAIADRLAEAFAECLHFKVRTDWWGYERQENPETFDLDALISERYRGIRPAPGYPACPDHSAKKNMFALLQCEEIGMTLPCSPALSSPPTSLMPWPKLLASNCAKATTANMAPATALTTAASCPPTCMALATTTTRKTAT